MQWWMDFFHELIVRDVFHKEIEAEVEVLRFCFMAVLQNELNEMSFLWNSHRMRPNIHARCPPGIPDQLYFSSENDGKVTVSDYDVADLYQLSANNGRCKDSTINQSLNVICEREGLNSEPNSPEDALELYLTLMQIDAL